MAIPTIPPTTPVSTTVGVVPPSLLRPVAPVRRPGVVRLVGVSRCSHCLSSSFTPTCWLLVLHRHLLLHNALGVVVCRLGFAAGSQTVFFDEGVCCQRPCCILLPRSVVASGHHAAAQRCYGSRSYKLRGSTRKVSGRNRWSGPRRLGNQLRTFSCAVVQGCKCDAIGDVTNCHNCTWCVHRYPYFSKSPYTPSPTKHYSVTTDTRSWAHPRVLPRIIAIQTHLKVVATTCTIQTLQLGNRKAQINVTIASCQIQRISSPSPLYYCRNL